MHKLGRLFAGIILLSAGLACTTPTVTQAQTCEARAEGSIPSYESGKANPIICDEHGNQRVRLTGPNGGTDPASVQIVTPTGTSVIDDDTDSVNTNLTHTLAGEAVADDVLKVEQRGYYTSITTAATTVVKSGPGWFQGCHVVGGTLGNVTIYDNTAASGAVVVAAFTPATADDLKSINTSFSVGLTVVTAAATNMTCVVR